MSATIAEQLGPLPLVSTVLRLDFALLESASSLANAQRLLERWATNKANDFGEMIDWGQGSGRINSSNINFEFATTEDKFSFFLSHKEHGAGASGRDWITEVCLEREADQVRCSARLSIRQPRNAQRPSPRAPKFISELVESVGASDITILSSTPVTYHGGNFDDFESLLLSPRRSLPLLAISEDQDSAVARVDAVKVASFLCGISHVAILDPVASWMLTERYGKERSTFRGAVRCYNPGFSIKDDPFQHKLWLSQGISRSNAFNSNGFLNICLTHLFAVTTARFAPYPLLTPAALIRKEAASTALSDAVGIGHDRSIFDELRMGIPESEHAAGLARAIQDANLGEVPIEVERASQEVVRELEEKAAVALRSKQEEITRLEQELLEARDETAQKNQELALLQPFKQEAMDLKEELDLLRGHYDNKDSQVVRDFWDGFNLFFDAAKNLTAQAARADRQEQELEEAYDAKAQLDLHITQIQGKLHHKERQLQSVFDDQRDKKQKITLFPKSWEALMEGARSTLSYVALPLEVDSRLKKCPFSESLAREIYELLEVLHGIGEETELDGRLSQEGLKIHQSHFVGDNAWFSDESATNKRDFRSELTFLNHRDGEAKLCPWHGKITQHQIRIHFEWPRAERERHITVVYIGPKLTKH